MKKKRVNSGVLKGLTMISQLGITMLTPIFLCAWFGYSLDKWCSTSCWFIILIVLGIMAAFRNAYYLTRQFYEKDLKKEREEAKYFEDLKKEREKKEREKKSKEF